MSRFLQVLKGRRDRAMFMLMLRCGLRVEEVVDLTLDAIDWRRLRLYVLHGTGAMDRVVYIIPDTREALLAYVQQRLASHVKRLFLVEKGPHKGSPISVRGIHQKRMEYYALRAGMAASCHHLRRTRVTQMSNANADLVSIQDLLATAGSRPLSATATYPISKRSGITSRR